MFTTECSNAGQFNSITRRTRRSLEHSYPEDRPDSFGYASSVFSVEAALYNNSLPADDVHHHHHHHTTSSSNGGRRKASKTHQDVKEQRSEQQDERIEGLEAVVAKMQRTIKVYICSLGIPFRNSLLKKAFSHLAENGSKTKTCRRSVP